MTYFNGPERAIDGKRGTSPRVSVMVMVRIMT
jgi:hypothetical protein